MKPPNQYTSISIPLAKKKNVILSCAECRRLKLKCSRVFPCANCVKKGCEAICPDGSLTTGKGNRFVLANTEFLHDKINTLSRRVRQLEDALEQTHASLSPDHPHPLLTPELRELKKPLEKGTENDMLSNYGSAGLTAHIDLHNGDSVETNEVIDAVGSLSVASPDRMTYHGSSANAFYLLTIEGRDEEEEEDETEDISLPDSIPWLGYSFPFSPDVNHVSDVLRGDILSCLPEPTEARELSDIYFQLGAWMYNPVLEQEYRNEIFSLFYDHSMSSKQDPLESHKLALLFFVFAMGKLLDLRSPAIQMQDAMKYYHIGKSALSLSPFLEARSIPALQALIVMIHFMFLANIESSRWMIMGMVVKLTQTIGLHRDGAKFSLSPEETFSRRSLLWEIYTYDSWQSLTFGRPNSFALSSIDCEMAHDTTHNEHGEVEMTFAAWKHRFSSQCLSIVHDQAFGARTPNYKIIQELDKKVRGFYIPPSLQVPGFGGKTTTSSLVTNGGEMERPSLQLTMQRYIAWSIKEITIFYMHRGYFARSVEENKDDPLGGKYGSSVLAAHGSACSFINLIKSLHSQHPGMAERMWFLFTHVFSCSIVLGSIAIKCPGIPLSRSAFSNLESAYMLFDSVSHHNRAMKVLPVLRRLRERASTSMSDHQSRRSLLTRLQPENPDARDDTEELVGGKTRLVPRRSSLSSSRAGTDSLPASSPRESPVTLRPHISITHDPTEMPPLAELPMGDTGMDSPMTVWQSSYMSQPTTNFQYPPLQIPSNNQYMDRNTVQWYNNNLQPFQNNYHQQPHLISPSDRQQMTLMTMGSHPDSSMYDARETSSFNGPTMMYPQQQPSPPSNDAHADWQQLYNQTMQGY